MIGKQNRDAITLFEADLYARMIRPDNILRRINERADFSWIREAVEGLYCEDNGRPSIDPETALRLMIAGAALGIKEDRALMEEARVNVAIRWFCGYGLYDELPDHSSLTRIRQRWSTEVFQEVFRRAREECKKAGMVDGRTIHIDATLIRANVSWSSMYEVAEPDEERVEEEGSLEVKTESAPASNKPSGGRKKVQKEKKQCRKKQRRKKRSRTDPDATLSTSKHNSPMEPCYKQHMAVDSKAGVIVDVFVTTGEANEGKQLPEQIRRVEEGTGVKIECVTADSGYASSANYAMLEASEIKAVIPPQRPAKTGKVIPATRFKRDPRHNRVHCPGKKILYPSYYNKTNNGWCYRSDAKVCAKCRLRGQCVPEGDRVRCIVFVDGHESLVRARRLLLRGDPVDKKLYNRHRGLVEGVHGEAKTRHGLNRAARRGTPNMAIQSFMTAAVINLKRLARGMEHFFARLLASGSSFQLSHRVNRFHSGSQHFLFAIPNSFLFHPSAPLLPPACRSPSNNRVLQHPPSPRSCWSPSESHPWSFAFAFGLRMCRSSLP